MLPVKWVNKIMKLRLILKGVFIAVCICIVLILALEYTNRVFFLPKAIFTRQIKQFAQEKKEIQILFCGESSVQRDVNPEVFDYYTFNFACRGENYIETYYKLKYYIKSMPNLKIVVLPLTFSSFTSMWPHKMVKAEYYRYGYITYKNMMEMFGERGGKVFIEKISSFYSTFNKKNMETFLENIKKLLSKIAINEFQMHKGYIENVGSFVSNVKTSKRVKTAFLGSDIYDENLLLYFEKTLRLCKGNNIEVVTLAYPLTGYYLEETKQYIAKEEFYRKILSDPKYKMYIRRHLDYSGVFIDNNGLFFDQDHLNNAGSEIFSKLVAVELSRIMNEINNYERAKD